MQHVVHGQPNIYALFMAVAVDLLCTQGEIIAITPRSYFNGLYFKKFRKWFFERVAIRQIHLFGSRKQAFKEDGVLQENVVIRACKETKQEAVLLTQSEGRELENATTSLLAATTLFGNRDGERWIRLTAGADDQEIIEAVDNLPHRFRDLGYKVSTGAVVPFRATEFLRDQRADDTAPLLWMHHVGPFRTRSSPRSSKPSHIVVNQASKKLLLPAQTYVLLKRFTAKEEKRRLRAGIVTRSDSYSPRIAFENHLNFLYRSDGELSFEEAFGLAAYFNSSLIDRYFRTISGSTQVNAIEIRNIPMPARNRILDIGAAILAHGDHHPSAVEEIVGKALGLSKDLVNRLVAGSDE